MATFPPVLSSSAGTLIDTAYLDAYDADIEAAVVDTTSGGGAGSVQTPAQTTAEVRDARDGEASLTAKLDAMESAFTGVGPPSIRNGFVYGNCFANDTFAMWSGGDAAAPDHWVLGGTGAAVARCGVGQADTQVIGDQDHFSARLTYGSAEASLRQYAIESGAGGGLFAFTNTRYRPTDTNGQILDGYVNDNDRYLHAYVIGHVFSGGSNRARMHVAGSTAAYSPYHPGDSTWSALIAGPVEARATSLSGACIVSAAGAAYFIGVGLFLTPLELPPMYVPCRVRYRTITYYTNNPATGVLNYYTFARPAFIIGAQMQCLTAGTVTAPAIDLLTPVLGTYQSLFVTAPTIATGQLVGAAQACDPAAANYFRRTIRPALSASATQVNNTSLRLDYVDDGGGTLRDLMVTIHYFEYERPLDQFRGIADLGEA